MRRTFKPKTSLYFIQQTCLHGGEIRGSGNVALPARGHREGLPPLEQFTQRVRSFMSLRPTQSSRGHDAGSQSAAQTASVPGVTAAGAVSQGPHVSAPSSGGQASGSKGPGASGASAAAGSSAGGGSRKREWPQTQVELLAVEGGSDLSTAPPKAKKLNHAQYHR